MKPILAGPGLPGGKQQNSATDGRDGAGAVDEDIAMKQSIRSKVVLAAVFAFAGTMCFAESGAAIYKANCQACHGSTGTPSPGIAKMMGVKPASQYKSSEAEMIAAVKNGKGKMKAFSGKLNDAQIKDAVTYFRSLK